MSSETTKLWAMHVPGADDVYAMVNEAAAHDAVAEYNNGVKEMGLSERFGIPEEELFARVIEWPHSAESHAESLEDGEPQVLDLTNLNIP
jgi:hypothetical protein